MFWLGLTASVWDPGAHIRRAVHQHSVNVTYIAAAEATGLVTAATQHNVTDVAKAKDGRWEIPVDRITTKGTMLENNIITTGGACYGGRNRQHGQAADARRGEGPDPGHARRAGH